MRRGDWVTSMDGTVVTGTGGVTTHRRTLLHGVLQLDGFRSHRPPGGVGGGSYANDAGYRNKTDRYRPQCNNTRQCLVFDPGR